MSQILEYLETAEVDGTQVNRCLRCGHVLGEAAEDFKTQAASFDAPSTAGEPERFGKEGEWVLRHFICPGCGVLLEIDMLPRDQESVRSVQLD
jgi:acetone carboxylase gamma subunit